MAIEKALDKFPHVVIIADKSDSFVEDPMYHDRVKWLHDHVGVYDRDFDLSIVRAHTHSDHVDEVYSFEHLKDALLFKLTWGGE